MSAKQLDTRHVEGARCEHLAIAYLLERNWHVAKNTMYHGPFDLIATKFYGQGKKKIVFIDVKYVSRDKDGFYRRRVLSKEQIEFYGVTPLYVWSSGQIDFIDPTSSASDFHIDYEQEFEEPFAPLDRRT